jgi:hypothetical protein
MAKQTNKVIISRFGRMPIFNRPTTLNADNNPRTLVAGGVVSNPLARKPR